MISIEEKLLQMNLDLREWWLDSEKVIMKSSMKENRRGRDDRNEIKRGNEGVKGEEDEDATQEEDEDRLMMEGKGSDR